MRTNFRQGIISHQAGGFLQVAGNAINILASSRPVTVTVAHKDSNYTHSEDNSVNNAWTGPFTATNYWLYWDFNPLTFTRTFGKTTLEPVAQSAEPGSGNSTITGAIPGAAGIGAFVVNGYFVLPVGKEFAVIDSTYNNGTYTVKSISYSTSTGKTTIFVDEAVASSTIDGVATLDIDSYGIPLYTQGRHWFNTATNIHYVLETSMWRPVLRVFAAQLLNGNTLISPSQNSQAGSFIGTQVGNNNAVFSGRVLFDEASNPIRKDDSTFFTTESQFFSNQSRVDALRLESNVTRAQCATSALSAFSVVAWTADGKVDTAQYSSTGATVLGLLTEDITYLEVGAIILQGTVTNPNWNWTSGATPTPVGSALWVNNGALVTVDPHISNPTTYPTGQVPVARVLDKDTIIFEQGLGGKGDRGPSGGLATVAPADTTNLGGVTLVTPSSDAARAFVISDTDSRLTNARTPLSHNHQASNITFQAGGGIVSTNVQNALLELGNGKLSKTGGIMTGALTLSGAPTASGHATTKQYVDSLVNGLIWLEPIDLVNLISDVIQTPPTTPLRGDSYIVPAGATGAWSAITVGNIVQWDEDTSLWVDLGPLADIHQDEEYIRIGIALRSTTTPSGTFLGRKNQIAVYNSSAVLLSYTVPVTNNAVYVEAYATEFAFDQYAFDGTTWIRFGGSNQALTGDGLTTDITAGVISVLDTVSGGQVDALTFAGNTLVDLDLRWSLVTHNHIASSISTTAYTGDGTWGTPVDPTLGKISSVQVAAALNELANEKAAKAPLYATTAQLPSAVTQKGMLATVDDVDTVYFADGTNWIDLARGDHTHIIPYDMAFYVHGALLSSQNIGIFAVTRDVWVANGAPSSVALCGTPASTLPTTLTIKKSVVPYSTSTQVGSIQFSAGSYVGVITWGAGVLLEAGDMLILATDASPSDVEQVSVTIVGCATAATCVLPAAPTVVFTPGTQIIGNSSLITEGGGNVGITGTFTSILWEQLEYTDDGGINYYPDPGVGINGHLIFADPTIQVPIVSENSAGLGFNYRVRITVTGPGGIVFDEAVIDFGV